MPPTVMTPWWRTTCCELAARVECEPELELFVPAPPLGEEELVCATGLPLGAAEPDVGLPEEACVCAFTPPVAGCNGAAACCTAVLRC